MVRKMFLFIVFLLSSPQTLTPPAFLLFNLLVLALVLIVLVVVACVRYGHRGENNRKADSFLESPRFSVFG